jgi:heme/copper-type cytochrome/quinol oxidase subunit 4
MKNRKVVSFLISLVSPILPIAALLVFDRLEQALPVLITCAVILCAVIVSIFMLLKTKEKSPGMKIIGTVFGVLGIVVTGVIGLIAGWTLTKI